MNILQDGINLYKQKAYSGALAFFLSLPANSGADKIEIAYFLGLCYAKLERYDDALLYLEQVGKKFSLYLLTIFYKVVLILPFIRVVVGWSNGFVHKP